MITRERIEATLDIPVDQEYGGIATFTGVVRRENRGRTVSHIHYDCYDALALRELGRIREEALANESVGEVRITHRVGDVPVGDIALFVVVSARRRKLAFEVCERVVEEVKGRVPIWKKEYYNDAAFQWL